jgi:hypothetical protein
MSRQKYLSIQLAILALPPLLAMNFVHLNPYVRNPVEAYSIYSGVSGLAVASFVETLHENTPPGYLISSLCLVPYFGVYFALYWASYQKEGHRNSVLVVLNSFLSLWSFGVGAFFMKAAMQ